MTISNMTNVETELRPVRLLVQSHLLGKCRVGLETHSLSTPTHRNTNTRWGYIFGKEQQPLKDTPPFWVFKAAAEVRGPSSLLPLLPAYRLSRCRTQPHGHPSPFLTPQAHLLPYFFTHSFFLNH